MEIRDVIGSLRQSHLDLLNQINAIRLDIHLIEYRLSKMEERLPIPVRRKVSRETESLREELIKDGSTSALVDTPLPGFEA